MKALSLAFLLAVQVAVVLAGGKASYGYAQNTAPVYVPAPQPVTYAQVCLARKVPITGPVAFSCPSGYSADGQGNCAKTVCTAPKPVYQPKQPVYVQPAPMKKYYDVNPTPAVPVYVNTPGATPGSAIPSKPVYYGVSGGKVKSEAWATAGAGAGYASASAYASASVVYTKKDPVPVYKPAPIYVQPKHVPAPAPVCTTVFANPVPYCANGGTLSGNVCILGYGFTKCPAGFEGPDTRGQCIQLVVVAAGGKPTYTTMQQYYAPKYGSALDKLGELVFTAAAAIIEKKLQDKKNKKNPMPAPAPQPVIPFCDSGNVYKYPLDGY